MSKRLVKSSSNRVLAGVIGGISEYFYIDATVLRLIFVVFLLFSLGTASVFYIIAAIIMPGANDNVYQYGHDNPYYKKSSTNRPNRKEAEKLDNDNWSDF